MTTGTPAMRRATAERLATDPDFRALLQSDPGAAAAELKPEVLESYRVADDERSNCGTVCGCDAAKGVGCEGVNGIDDQGSDCPNKKG